MAKDFHDHKHAYHNKNQRTELEKSPGSMTPWFANLLVYQQEYAPENKRRDQISTRQLTCIQAEPANEKGTDHMHAESFDDQWSQW